MLYNLIEMIITIIGINPGIVQMLSPIIAGILDRIARRILTRIWSKITGEKPSPTPTSNAHDIIHLLITEFETKPHFREYVYIITKWLLNTISFIIHKIFTPTFFIILGIFTILIICCFRTLDFFLPLSTIIINI